MPFSPQSLHDRSSLIPYLCKFAGVERVEGKRCQTTPVSIILPKWSFFWVGPIWSRLPGKLFILPLSFVLPLPGSVLPPESWLFSPWFLSSPIVGNGKFKDPVFLHMMPKWCHIASGCFQLVLLMSRLPTCIPISWWSMKSVCHYGSALCNFKFLNHR